MAGIGRARETVDRNSASNNYYHWGGLASTPIKCVDSFVRLVCRASYALDLVRYRADVLGDRGTHERRDPSGIDLEWPGSPYAIRRRSLATQTATDTHRLPERHAPQDDRTDDFVLIAYRAMDDSDGSCGVPQSEFGGDEWPISCIDFASFAMLATLVTPLGPGAEAIRIGEFADFRFGTMSAQQFVARSCFFDNNFLSQSGLRLTSNSRARNLTTATKRGKAIDMSWSVRDQF